MNLLASTLQRSSAINVAVYGNFSAPKQQEILVARGSQLELLRPDDTGKVLSISSVPVFANIRSIIPFRLSGANKDYAVIGSDSGKISIIEFDTSINDWKLVHCEVFGRSGCRRIVPGQYVAADPKGRAILIAGVEKQKFVYVTSRDSTTNKLTISSPLEAHKADTILFSVVGVDVGFDNPIFAMIELEYTEADQDPTGEAAQEVEKKLTYYEVDLGLNHVVRKWSEPISRTANFLLTVPGGDTWPSGVLICGENWVSYKHQGHVEVRAPLPRRHDLPVKRGVLITSGTVHKQKDLFFFLLQSEYGDLYKVTLEQDPADPKTVKNVVVAVFDTIMPSTSLCITKTGLLFAASEFGNHALFQFQGIDDPTAIRSGCIMDDELNEELGDDSASAARVAPLFKANPKLQNLLMTDDINSLAPTTDMIVGDLAGEGTTQIYAACGKGHRSTLRTLRHGVSFTEMAVSELPGRPIAVWTVKKTNEDEFDHFIVVSFSNATLVLSIGENVEEVTDSGFLTTSPTLQVALLADNAMIQVHNLGIRHIRADQRVSEWKTPGRRNILMATVNARQVAIALSGGDVTYFELDAAGTLVEMGTIDMGKEVSSLNLGVIPEGRSRSMFLAVGCDDDSVQLLTLDPSDVLAKGPSEVRVESRPTSLCFVEMKRGTGAEAETRSSSSSSSEEDTVLYLNVGLEKGVLFRVTVDPVTGAFSDARQRYLGSKPVKLCRVSVQGQPSLLALTSRSWLMYNFQKRAYQDPVSYEPLEYASDFTSDACPDGIVAVSGNTLRVLTIDNLGEVFNQQSMSLSHTPRKMCHIVGTSHIALIETDHNEYNEAEKAEKSAAADAGFGDDGAASSSSSLSTSAASADEGAMGLEEEEEEESTIIPVRGPVPAVNGHWASCVRVVDSATKTTIALHELLNNEAAFSLCSCNFRQHSAETFLVVGSVRNFIQSPKSFTGCYITVYRMLEGILQPLHQTEVEDIPATMVEFQGKLLVGIGKILRLYDMGKKKLLKKCENKLLPNMVMKLQVNGDRIYVGDLAESVHFVKYNSTNNTLSIFADDTCPRFVTCLCIIDYATIACGDKFGNVFVLRLPDDANEDAAIGAGAGRGWFDKGLLNGAPNKLELLNHYYVNEIPTSINKASLKQSGKEILIVSTISGGLYAFAPSRTKEEVSFFQHLEMFMRQESSNVCGRDHLSFRSYYQPVKHVLDGELCARFTALPAAKQREFAEDTDRNIAEIHKKLEEMREFL